MRLSGKRTCSSLNRAQTLRLGVSQRVRCQKDGGRWRNLKWKFSNWNSNFGFKCLSGGSVWICHWNANHFACSLVCWGIEKFTYFDFQNIKPILFNQNAAIGNAFIQQAGIHYSCLYMFTLDSQWGDILARGLLMNYSLAHWNCFGVFSLDTSWAVCWAIQLYKSSLRFEDESHRTSWWPSGSNFLLNLSPRVLGRLPLHSGSKHKAV